jgi:hypothetical protein
LLFGLGLPQWLTILALVGAVWLTFWVMARASIAYERRRAKESRGMPEPRDVKASAGSLTPDERRAREEEP